jgi:hypothetical protein
MQVLWLIALELALIALGFFIGVCWATSEKAHGAGRKGEHEPAGDAGEDR